MSCIILATLMSKGQMYVYDVVLWLILATLMSKGQMYVYDVVLWLILATLMSMGPIYAYDVVLRLILAPSHETTSRDASLAEYLRKVKRPKGRPQRTWMELIKHDLKAIIILDYNKPNKTIEQLTQMAHDRNYWRNIVRRVVLQK